MMTRSPVSLSDENASHDPKYLLNRSSPSKGSIPRRREVRKSCKSCSTRAGPGLTHGEWEQDTALVKKKGVDFLLHQRRYQREPPRQDDSSHGRGKSADQQHPNRAKNCVDAHRRQKLAPKAGGSSGPACYANRWCQHGWPHGGHLLAAVLSRPPSRADVVMPHQLLHRAYVVPGRAW